jgi:Rod binding domain-containing protein
MKVMPTLAHAQAPTPVTTAATASSARDSKVHKAAQDFEAMFVREILRAAKVTGHDKPNGYDSMAVDAIASSVTKGGGLGLAREIEAALSHAAAAHGVAPSPQPQPSIGPLAPRR